jgi:sugar (pentulose or hexulose) kinase
LNRATILHFSSIGIDTRGADYALADTRGEVSKPVRAYRDSRTGPFFDKAGPAEARYKITGIAPQPFTTIYRRIADKRAEAAHTNAEVAHKTGEVAHKTREVAHTSAEVAHSP